MKNEILKTLEEYLSLIDGEIDREEEIASLKKQIEFQRKEFWEERNNAYLAQLREFKNYMDTCFDVLMNTGETPESVDVFYRSDFTVTWRGKSVTLVNGVEVFQSIEEIIDCEIADYEEG